jgi:hypothetical protein
MKPVGRPPQVDINGDPIKKCLLNVTIPTELADFLRRKEVNRSKLFTKVVGQLYANEICSKCFSKDITESPIGMHCKPCSRYDHKQGWYHLKRCTVCHKQYKPGVNVPMAIKGSDVWSCQECQE